MASTTQAMSGPLAAERAVMMAASAASFRLAAVDCTGFTREQLAEHTVAMVQAAELVRVTTARFMAFSDYNTAALLLRCARLGWLWRTGWKSWAFAEGSVL